MALVDNLIGLGMSPELAGVVSSETYLSVPTKDVDTGLTATGSAITDALDLTALVNVIGTTAASTGVQLPAVAIGQTVVVQNDGANALSVYPHSASAAINGGSAGAAVTTAAAAGAICVRTGSLSWLVYVVAKES